jgi:hypothetical protein
MSKMSQYFFPEDIWKIIKLFHSDDQWIFKHIDIRDLPCINHNYMVFDSPILRKMYFGSSIFRKTNTLGHIQIEISMRERNDFQIVGLQIPAKFQKGFAINRQMKFLGISENRGIKCMELRFVDKLNFETEFFSLIIKLRIVDSDVVHPIYVIVRRLNQLNDFFHPVNIATRIAFPGFPEYGGVSLGLGGGTGNPQLTLWL